MKELEELETLGIKNPYMMLEVKESANDEEIKSAYRRLIKLYGNNPNAQQDNYYLIQMFTSARKALLNHESRKIIDKKLTEERKQHSLKVNEELKTNNKTTKNNQGQTIDVQVEEILANSTPKQQEIARTEILLPEILESLGLTTYNDELSFADIQLILKEYLKRSWSTFRRPKRNTDDEMHYISNTYLLLDKKGKLTSTRYYFYHDGYARMLAIKTINDIEIYRLNWNTSDHKTLSNINKILPDDECMVALTSIYPETISYNERISKRNIVTGLELGNECLLQLGKNGYLKKSSPKEFIKY